MSLRSTTPRAAADRPRLLAIVMPAYNEEACIAAVVASLLTLLDEIHANDGTDGRLLVVNDGSKDGTLAILRACAARDQRVVVVDKPNGGHGQSILRGYREAIALNADWVFQIDSDDQFEIQDFHALWARRHESPFTLGYRAQRHDPLHRLVITRILRTVLVVGFGCRVRDANVPYRLIDGAYLRALLRSLKSEPFAPNIFLSIMASSHLGKIGEIAVRHRERATGTISIVRWRLLRVCFQTVGELMTLRRDLSAIKQELAAAPSGEFLASSKDRMAS